MKPAIPVLRPITYLLSLILALMLSLTTAQAQSRDLPEGSFYVAGEVLPAIKQGALVPVQVHLTLTGNRLEWRFITSFLPNAASCERDGKCHQVVQSLSHDVTWNADGTLTLDSTDLKTGPDLTIDRAEFDNLLVHAPVSSLVDRAILTLDASGGTLTKTGVGGLVREVTLIPATLDQTLAAVSVPYAFELSLSQLDQCAIRQVLGVYNAETRSPVQADLLRAAKHFHHLYRLNGAANYYSLHDAPADQAERLDSQRLHATAAQMTFSFAAFELAKATDEGKTLSDAEILTIAEDALSKLRDRLGDQYDVIRTDILDTRGSDLIAAARLSARMRQLIKSGTDPYAAVCADVTLGG